ncbi:SPL family radical SAM protein [Desulfogranum japonicum]|uniref:SPL family radical SAM protein n=1 Tax=Desulfogranum japonicum TaxID=231447 RepID=UPI0004062CB2|nr:radical SAM protein [Desulfogranum japonicum]
MTRNKSYGDPAKYVRHLHITEDCEDNRYTQEILERTGLPYTILKTAERPVIEGTYPGNLTEGKHHLLLCKNLGTFFKPCPGTKEYRCCDYQVLNIGMGCPMDCVYCILQAYLNNPWMSFFVNIEKLFTELDQGLADKSRVFRIGTGEFTDSLAIDSITHLSPRLVNYIRDKENCILELKSKSVVIDNLKGLDHNGRTILAWSLNSQQVMAQEEIRTASFEERLQAAAQVAEWGYHLAFHFDPIIYHDGWQEGYRETIRRLFASVPTKKIVWISLGALRYLPALKEIAGLRFSDSRFFYEEFVDGLDGKKRYFRTERVAMYRFILAEIQKYAAPSTCVYFCMENDEIWQEVFGFVPEEKGGIPAMLDRAVGLAPC